MATEEAIVVTESTALKIEADAGGAADAGEAPKNALVEAEKKESKGKKQKKAPAPRKPKKTAVAQHPSYFEVPFYAAAQLTGSIAASFALKTLLQPIEHLGTATPSGTDLQALIMEITVTFTMMFVTSVVATDSKAVGELAGIAVGSAVCITSILAGPVSGGSMNPARTITYKGIWVYMVGPVTGTLSGAMCYSFIRAAN